MHSFSKLTHTEKKKEIPPLVNQPKNRVIPSKQRDGTSPCTMAFLCSFLWLHQTLPHTRCQPYPNLSHSQQRTWSTAWEKNEANPFLLLQSSECLCVFLQLSHWIPSSFRLLWALIPFTPPQFHFHFYFSSTSSSQTQACWISLSKVSHSGFHSTHSKATCLKSKLDWNWRWMGKKKGKKKRVLDFLLYTFLLHF